MALLFVIFWCGNGLLRPAWIPRQFQSAQQYLLCGIGVVALADVDLFAVFTTQTGGHAHLCA